MLTTKTQPGAPRVSIKWPKGAVISTLILKNEKGRFICKVKVNDGEYFTLPSSHPTEAVANSTLQAYIAENSSQEGV